MNNDRRKRIGAIQGDISKAGDEINKLIAEANELIEKANEAISAVRDRVSEMKDNLQGEVDEIKDEEQETYDNMPESLQNSERGELASEAINNLESASDFFDNLDPDEAFKDINLLEEIDLSEVDGDLDNAAQ